jgi:predicted transcriptional regulator
MTRLNKTQKYAIQWLISNNFTTEDVAKELKIDLDKVNKFVKTNVSENISQTQTLNHEPKNSRSQCVYRPSSDKDSHKNKKTALDMMITKTSSKATKSVCIMTKEASEISDANKQKK